MSPKMEFGQFGMCPIWNVSNLECVENGMGSIWNVQVLEFGMCRRRNVVIRMLKTYS